MRIATSLDDLARIGVVDVGSNSVRLVVFDGAARAPAYFYNEKVLAGLGRGLRETGMLHPEGRVRALAAIARFMMLARSMDLTSIRAVATAAVREARDGPDFAAEVEAETGLKLQVIPGEEEARLSAQGVLLGRPQARGLVCDIGGASMELARVASGEVKGGVTTPLGPLALNGLSQEARKKTIKKTMQSLKKSFAKEGRPLFLVGGSWRAIGGLDMERCKYPLRVLQSYEMSPKNCIQTARWAQKQDAQRLKQLMPNTSTARLELVPQAANVLAPLIQTLKPSGIFISSYGIREGLLYDQMTPDLRALDPLIEAAKHMEASSSRFPGFGTALYKWMAPLYPDASSAEKRLIKAAALLHDVNWRAHPDYRAEMCFETVTRANLGALSHGDRIFLGLALTRRYKSGTPSPRAARLAEMLGPEREAHAVALGKALRLGSMLSADARGILKAAKLRIKGSHLELRLHKEAAMHAGEIVERRLASLAAAHGLEAQILDETG